MLAFWRYYGGKKRAAARYPAPVYDTIAEPFAGAAGYALRYHTRRVILCDRDPNIRAVWRYLIAATPAEILRLPLVEHLDDLPSWVPQEARIWLGFRFGQGDCGTRRKMSPRSREGGAWSERTRGRLASQVDGIKHWTLVESTHDQLDNIRATWFVDPPYNNKAGTKYRFGARTIDYEQLGAWCRTRQGQAIVCENEGADWLPFAPLFVEPGVMNTHRTEVYWHALNGFDLTAQPL